MTAVAFVSISIPVAPAYADESGDAGSGGGTSGPSGTDLAEASIGGEIASSVAERVGGFEHGGDVTPGGSYSMSIPMQVPPGIRGVQPSLAVAYDSQSDNGMLGVGAVLTGLPAVVRTAGVVGDPQATTVEDAVRTRARSFDSHDTFSLAANGYGTDPAPGSRLVQLPGTGLFHTATQSWVQFRPLGHCAGSQAVDADFAPCAWEARDGAGNTSYFGLRPSGQLWERDAGHDQAGASVEGRGILAWGLTHYVDADGNAYRVTYEQDEMMLRPIGIEYGCQLVVNPGAPATPQPDPVDEFDDDDGEMPDPPWDGEPPPEWENVPQEEPVTPRSPAGDWTYDPFGEPINSAEGTIYEIDLPPDEYLLPVDDVANGDDDPSSVFSCGGVRRISFRYDPRADITPMPYMHRKRLAEVTMYADGGRLHSYQLAYEKSPSTSRSRLQSLTFVGADETTALPPTRFTWSTGTAWTPESLTPGNGSVTVTGFGAMDWPEKSQWYPHAPGEIPAVSDRGPVATHVGDIDGDGYDDIVRVAHAVGHHVSYLTGREIEQQGVEGATPVEVDTPSISALEGDGGTYEHAVEQSWRSLLADTDTDGYEDLVLWRASLGSAEIHIAHGSVNGLGGFVPYAHNTTLGSWVEGLMVDGQYPEDVAKWYELVPADVNGDQHLDLALVNRQQDRPRVALLTGTPTGLAQPAEIFGRPVLGEHEVADGDKAYPSATSVMVGDVDGDGLQDIYYSISSKYGVYTQVFLGHFNRGLRRGKALKWASVSQVGYPRLSVVSGDFNGDQVGDVVLAYSGGTRAKWVHYGRVVMGWLGEPDLPQLPRDIFGFVADNAREFFSLMSNQPYPESSYNNPLDRRPWSVWRHHSADVNGDGASDLVATYDGIEGNKAEYALSNPLGILQSSVTSITECPERQTPATSVKCHAQPDGNREVHKWNTVPVDLDGDGRDDLVRYFAGDTGSAVEIAWGSAEGLRPYDRIIESSDPVTESGVPADTSFSASVSLSFPDLNADGNRDILLATYEGVSMAVTDPGSANEPAKADVLTALETPYGGTVAIEYESAPRLQGAVDRLATDCGDTAVVATSGTECGLPRTDPRPLVTRLTANDGRGPLEIKAYAYENGRYAPGPLVSSDQAWPKLLNGQSGLTARADLGFQRTVETDEQTATVVTRVFRQDRPLQRALSRTRIDVFDDVSEQLEVSSTESASYQALRDPATGIVRVRKTGVQGLGYEHGVPSTQTYLALTHDDYDREVGRLEGVGRLVETARTYVTDPSPDRWILHRPDEVKSRVLFSSNAIDNVLGWIRYQYVGDRLAKSESLVCDDANDCVCFSSPDATDCITSGVGRWVSDREVTGWDLVGNPTDVVDAMGEVTTIEWDSTYSTHPELTTRVVESVDPTTGETESIDLSSRTTYDGMGRALTITDVGNGNSQINGYDPLGRLEATVHPNGRAETWAYVDLGDADLQHLVHETTTGPGGFVELDRTYFTGTAEPYRVESSGANGQEVVVRRERALELGRHVVLTSEPFFDGTSPSSIVWRKERADALGRPQHIEAVADAMNPSGGDHLAVLGGWDYQHDSRSQWTSTNDVDHNGHVTMEQPVRSRTEVFNVDGEITKVVEHGRETEYFYDDAGRVDHIYGPHEVGPTSSDTPFKLWWFDSRGLVTRYEDDASGLSTFGYRDDGQLEWSDDALGRLVSHTYDAAGRRDTTTNFDGTTVYEYDQATRGIGLLSSVTAPWGVQTIAEYDRAGNATTIDLTIAGLMGAQREQFVYDGLGRIQQKILPDGTQIDYGYGPGAVLESVRLDGGLLADFEDYDASGRVGLRTTDASFTSYDYDAFGRLQEMVVLPAQTSSPAPLMAYRYGYNAAGDVRSIQDVRVQHYGTTIVDPGGANIDTNDSWTFGYDLLGRLSGVTDFSGAYTAYDYDAADRLSQKGDVTYAYSTGQVLGTRSSGIDFDVTRNVAGEVVSKDDGLTVTGYGYDAAGRVTSVTEGQVTTASFLYDDKGRRIVKTEYTPVGFASGGSVPTQALERYIVSSNYEIEVRNNPHSGAWEQTVTRHIDAPGMGVIATVSDAGVSTAATNTQVLDAADGYMAGSDRLGSPHGTYFIHSNYLGSTSVVTDEDSVVVSRYIQDPYGERNGRSTGYDASARQFTGQVRDAGTGLYYYGARYYDPQVGLFMTADRHDDGTPYLPGGVFNPAGLNRHAYAFNNPVTYNDPSGHDPKIHLRADAPVRSHQLLKANQQEALLRFGGQNDVREALSAVFGERVGRKIFALASTGDSGEFVEPGLVDTRYEVSVVFDRIQKADAENIGVTGDVKRRITSGVSSSRQTQRSTSVSVSGEASSPTAKVGGSYSEGLSRGESQTAQYGGFLELAWKPYVYTARLTVVVMTRPELGFLTGSTKQLAVSSSEPSVILSTEANLDEQTRSD